MKLDKTEQLRIREFVLGIFAGINASTSDTLIEVLGEDHWFSWSDSLDVNLYADEDGDLRCAVYPVVDGQTDGNTYLAIPLDQDKDFARSS
jgi:hypothetical protein